LTHVETACNPGFEIHRIQYFSKPHFQGDVMFRFTRRAARLAGVRFCDSCTAATTASERARRHHERTVLRAQTLLGPR
jgi:hypothetical protein